MALCACKEGPRCEAYGGACGNRADWTCMVPLTWKAPPVRLGPKFFCADCLERFKTAWRTRMKGIDKPPGADDDWRPSIMEHIRLCAIDAQINEQAERNRSARAQEPTDVDGFWSRYWRQYEKDYTPAQRRCALAWRNGLRDMRASALPSTRRGSTEHP